jgi:hypothetical protein
MLARPALDHLSRSPSKGCTFKRYVVLGTGAHTCNPSYSGGRDQEILVGRQPGKIVETLSQKYNIKKVWWSDSSGKVPTSKCEALSLNTSTAKRKRKKEKVRKKKKEGAQHSSRQGRAGQGTHLFHHGYLILLEHFS